MVFKAKLKIMTDGINKTVRTKDGMQATIRIRDRQIITAGDIKVATMKDMETDKVTTDGEITTITTTVGDNLENLIDFLLILL